MEPRLTIDARMLGFSGIGTYTRGLLEGLAEIESEFEIEVIYGRRESLGRLLETRLRFVEGTSPIYGIREQVEIVRLAKGAALLHCPHYNVPVLFPGKLVVTIHDLIHITDPTFKRSILSWIYARPMYYLAAHKARHVVTDSDYSKRQIVRHLNVMPSKVTVIPLGVGSHFLERDKNEARARVSAELGLRRPFVLYVGNLRPHKNLANLVQAFSLLRTAKACGYQLVIVGEESKWKQGLVREVQRLRLGEDVLFMGRVSDSLLPYVYVAADLFVMPSLIEGFGLPVLEAMACGTPVVCSRAASLPEVAGDAAEYFEPSSVDDLARAMERVSECSELGAKLRQSGLEQVKRFSWKECARRHCEVYRSVLER